MRRLCLYCLVSLPLLAHADTDGLADIPPPPKSAAPVSTTKATRNPAANTTKADASEPSANPEPPELPPNVRSGENLEPDITIKRKGDEMIHEYRENGVLYMVKIIPDKGPAYYLLDTNGDGKWDMRRSDMDRGIDVNMWKLYEWK